MKKIIILALVFAGLASFVYFYEVVGENEREEARKIEERLLRLEQDEIEGLEIQIEGEPGIVLKRDGEGWVLKEPLETVADKTTVNSLLKNLTDARRARTFEEVGAGLDQYGLDKASMRLKVETSDQQKWLLLGDKDYTGNELYVKLDGEPQVFLTSALILSSADKELLDWRDKSILTFERGKLQEISIQRAAEEIILRKNADQWFLEAPFEELADDGTVSGLLSILESGEAKEFVSEDAEDLTEFGLADPTVVVRVREEGEDSWRQLELGSQSGERVFARNPVKSFVFTVEKDVLKDLFQDVWEFRSKQVVDVDQDEISKITIDREEQKIVVRREEYKWILEMPEEHKDKEAQAYKFWYPIDDIEFESISDTVVEFPQAETRVLMELNDGSLRNYEFVKRGDEYLARQVETGRSGKISLESYEKLDFKVEDLTD